ncbi:MAG: hypothetical protein JO325_22650 [Solirubrobacterales bacterium]|nr:hypothetical protein [Solirubrobacterales bacterium]
MLTRRLHAAGLRDWQMQSLSFGSIGLCVALWIRAKTVDQDERGNAERRALFVGLWPPSFWLIGDSLERIGSRERGPGRGRWSKTHR